MMISSILKRNVVWSFVGSNFLSTATGSSKMETLFLNREVRQILKKITGLNYDKVFAPEPKMTRHERDIKYEFATAERLEKLAERMNARAAKKLQMPPVVEIRKPINEVLSRDPELQGYLYCKTVFTDLSTNVSNRDRIVTVREVDGTLRRATWEEKDRMNQIFFPINGRSFDTPQLFESPNLERLLNEGSYEFVLDSTCVQFEPDSEEYHKFTHQTYEHMKQTKRFDGLRSTRHFGPMAFYFAYRKDVDTLLLDMIERQLTSDAVDTIRMLHIMHPDSIRISGENDIEILQGYIKNHSSDKSSLERALQTLIEQQQARESETEQSETASVTSV